ncbi:hypothetical protein BG005_009132, partial [Podila minutissima]
VWDSLSGWISGSRNWRIQRKWRTWRTSTSGRSWISTAVWCRENSERSGSICLGQARPLRHTWPASLSKQSKNSVGLNSGGTWCKTTV